MKEFEELMQSSTILRNVFLSAALASAVLAVYLVSSARRPVGAKAVTGRRLRLTSLSKTTQVSR